MIDSDGDANTPKPNLTASDFVASRRAILAASAAAAGIGAGKLGVLAQDSAATPAAGTTGAANACMLTPKLTEGPYFLEAI